MKHEVKEMSGVLVVALEGDVDLESSPAARKVLLECLERDMTLLVDMSSVTYIDSSGVASLVESLQSARQRGASFALVAVSQTVMRVLELARLDKVFTIFESLEEGLAGDG